MATVTGSNVGSGQQSAVGESNTTATPGQVVDTAPLAQGQWTDPFLLPNVAIHAHLLPNEKVLFWGRRQQPTDNSFESLNEWATHAFLLDLVKLTCVPTSNQPADTGGEPINLFCSSHTFLPDGRLMVTGGHIYDSQGIHCATIYDWRDDKWRAAQPMQANAKAAAEDTFWLNGRWYPTAITLADGSVFVCSGSHAVSTPAPAPHAAGNANNSTPEIWKDTPWIQLTPFVEQTDLPQFLFPRFHLAPDGRVFMSGAGADSFFFDTSHTGQWLQSATRSQGPRDYAPSVMYDVGKIVFMGGGNGPDQNLPSQQVEIINLFDAAPGWQLATPMLFRRRQHNATLLPDGTVLVTGGTQGGGGLGNPGFNDLTLGQPVHDAELWDPRTDTWTLMAKEQRDRCYHSTAVLLPDGRVMSAGGGEYQPTDLLAPNDASATHLDAQIFSPPYLFKGPRPHFELALDELHYNGTFEVKTADAADVEYASLIRLSSVTHSFNTGQRINFMFATPGDGVVGFTAPPNANVCPPGYYLLFLLAKSGVPSIGKMIKITGDLVSPHRTTVAPVDQLARTRRIIAEQTRQPVIVGLGATCPYGLGTCLAGAVAALKKLDGVETVLTILSSDDNRASVATVYLNHDGLPDLNKWPKQFAQFANSSYAWRGVEMTLAGTLLNSPQGLILESDEKRPAVLLAPLERADKVQIDQQNGVAMPLPVKEAEAYADLTTVFAVRGAGAEVSVTGPIKQTLFGYVLEVRVFHSQ
jgi:galactose oxidase